MYHEATAILILERGYFDSGTGLLVRFRKLVPFQQEPSTGRFRWRLVYTICRRIQGFKKVKS